MKRPSSLVVNIAALLALGGCDLGSPVNPPEAGTISGTLNYSGESMGDLVVDAWESMPPAGAALATQRIRNPSFPQPYRLAGLNAAEIFLSARLGEGEPGPAVLGTYPSVLQVSPVVLESGAGLVGADFELVDEGNRPEGPVAQVGARTLAGTVRFSGQLRHGDVLRGALYRHYPPRAAPADLQIVNVRAPVFPYRFSFSDVRDGTYFTVFYLDRNGDSPFGPGFDDVVAWSEGPNGLPVPISVTLGAGRDGVEVQLPGR